MFRRESAPLGPHPPPAYYYLIAATFCTRTPPRTFAARKARRALLSTNGFLEKGCENRGGPRNAIGRNRRGHAKFDGGLGALRCGVVFFFFRPRDAFYGRPKSCLRGMGTEERGVSKKFSEDWSFPENSVETRGYCDSLFFRAKKCEDFGFFFDTVSKNIRGTIHQLFFFLIQSKRRRKY